MQEWITSKIEGLKGLYDKCHDEKAIRSYIVCMIRLLNGLAQLQEAQFHRYEYAILYKPIKVFTEYFVDQIQKALAEENAGEKIKDILDIEDAICKLSDIYENVVNGTANADKQMFMALPVNSSVYKLSPKLYALYSNITDCLVDIFDKEDNSKYAFLLNPTMKSTLQTELLFNRRKASGKVVIIYTPVRILEELDSVLLYHTHEVFHTLTREERHRKERAYCLLLNMVNQIAHRLFDKVEFSKDERNNAICKELLDLWMGTQVDNFWKKCEGLPANDRFFYASEIKEYFSKELSDTLDDIEDRLEQDILEHIAGKYFEQEQSFDQYGKTMGNLLAQIAVIKGNLYQLKFYDTIGYLLERLLFLFRETYADVACLMTCEYEYETYVLAFGRSLQFHIDSAQMGLDDYHKIREKLVTKVMFPEECQREKGLLPEGGKIQSRKIEEISRQSDNRYVILDEYLIMSYVDYLNCCKQSLQETLSCCDKNKLDGFRKRIKDLSKIVEDDADTIFDILVGKESFQV